MKRICLYLVLFAGVSYHTRAQNIYNGGIADGFSYAKLGFNIYAGGGDDGFAYAIYTPAALPLTLLSFKAAAAGNTVVLYWQTDSEINVDHFEVERSATGSAFQYLATVAAKGNGVAGPQDYKLTDATPFAGKNYYRLKMVDIDGRYKYSPVVLVTLTLPAAALTIYPNPASKALNVSISATSNSRAVLSIYTAGGKAVARKPVQLVPGTGIFLMNIASLPPGLYFCKVEGIALPAISFIKE